MWGGWKYKDVEGKFNGAIGQRGTRLRVLGLALHACFSAEFFAPGFMRAKTYQPGKINFFTAEIQKKTAKEEKNCLKLTN